MPWPGPTSPPGPQPPPRPNPRPRPLPFPPPRLLAGLMAACLLSGCAGGVDSAPVGDKETSSADIVKMPYGYPDVASKCDGPNRVYTTQHGKSPAVAPNDPRCVK